MARVAMPSAEAAPAGLVCQRPAAQVLVELVAQAVTAATPETPARAMQRPAAAAARMRVLWARRFIRPRPIRMHLPLAAMAARRPAARRRAVMVARLDSPVMAPPVQVATRGAMPAMATVAWPLVAQAPAALEALSPARPRAARPQVALRLQLLAQLPVARPWAAHPATVALVRAVQRPAVWRMARRSAELLQLA
jgi:hypothetical protein